MALVRIEIDGKVRGRKPARAQLDIEQIALNGRTNRELGRGADRDLAQTVAEHDLTQFGQGRQALGQQAEQAGVIALLKRQTALVETKYRAAVSITRNSATSSRGAHRGAALRRGCPERPG